MSKSVIIVVYAVAAILALPFVIKLAGNPDAAKTPVPPGKPAVTPAASAPIPAPPSAPGTPVVVAFDPPNGGTNVSPAKNEIRVTFNVPMGPGFSWCGGGPHFPTTIQGQKPQWTPDRKTCILPVTLQPNWSYEFGLNAPSFKNFQSETGTPLVPVIYRFSTGPAGS